MTGSRHFFTVTLVLLGALLATSAVPAYAKPIQLTNLQLPESAAAHKQAVVDIFTKSYNAYTYV